MCSTLSEYQLQPCITEAGEKVDFGGTNDASVCTEQFKHNKKSGTPSDFHNKIQRVIGVSRFEVLQPNMYRKRIIIEMGIEGPPRSMIPAVCQTQQSA